LPFDAAFLFAGGGGLNLGTAPWESTQWDLILRKRQLVKTGVSFGGIPGKVQSYVEVVLRALFHVLSPNEIG
jgi:hypothetical protein